MAQGGSTGDWSVAGTADAAPDSERLRQELRDSPRELVDWEASCLKNIADLLDSLDRARARWESLGDDLTQAQVRLDRVQEERDLLAESHADAQKAREELRDVREELEAIRRERDDVAASLVAAREQIEAYASAQESGVSKAQEDLEGLQAEVARMREENAALEESLIDAKADQTDLERQQREGDETAQELRRLLEMRDQEVAAAKGRLVESDLAVEDAREQQATLQREVDALREARSSNAELAEEMESLRELHAKTEQKLVKVVQEHEQDLVQLFDLRTKSTRLEEKLDDSDKKTRRKVRKIIDKIHSELDEIGAPGDRESSYGERIRQLKRSDG